MSENFKVIIAGVFGTAVPSVQWFTENVEPVLRLLLVVGQLAVAVATVLYILRKWRKLRVAKKSEKEN